MDAPFPDGMTEEIERLLKLDLVHEVGLNIYPHVFYNSMFFPLQRMRETAQMIQLARASLAGRSQRIVMEIGADKAGGVYHWCKGVQPTHMIACEIRGTPYAPVFERTFPWIDFLWLEDSSYASETHDRVQTWLQGKPIDVLFIDGDKAHFLDDFIVYLPLMRHGGVIFMHDIQDEAPGNAFAIARNEPSIAHASMIIDTTESLEALARESTGVPIQTAYEHWLRYWGGRSCGVGVLRVE